MGETDLIPDDLTAAHFQKSVSRKRLYKQGTVTVGEKVRETLEKRAAMVGRRVKKKRDAEAWARSALTTLNRLQGEKLVDFIQRAERFRRGSLDERFRVMSSQDPLDRALCFLHGIGFGSAPEIDAVRRNPELKKGFAIWFKKFEKGTGPKQRIRASRRATHN